MLKHHRIIAIFVLAIEDLMIKAIFTTLPLYTSLFWAVLLFFSVKKEDYPKRILSLFMFISALLYLSHSAFFNAEGGILPISDTIYSFTTLAVYPLYYIYILSLTTKPPLSAKLLFWLIPAFIGFAVTGFTYAAMPAGDRALWISEYLTGIHAPDSFWIIFQRDIHSAVTICFSIGVFIFLGLGTRRIGLYHMAIRDFYSNTEGKTLHRIRVLMFLFLLTSMLSFLTNFLGKYYFAGSIFLLMIPSTLFSIMLFCLGFIGFRQQFTISDFLQEQGKEPEVLSPVSDLYSRMTRLMEKEMLYLQPDLKVSDLAPKLGTNRTYISQAINKELHISFCEWINTYRVKYAQNTILNLKAQNAKIVIRDIWVESGFASEASFYRIFKQITGLPPQKWIEKGTFVK